MNFFVSDITDAMILSGVLEGLFLRGCHLDRDVQCTAVWTLQRWFATA